MSLSIRPLLCICRTIWREDGLRGFYRGCGGWPGGSYKQYWLHVG